MRDCNLPNRHTFMTMPRSDYSRDMGMFGDSLVCTTTSVNLDRARIKISEILEKRNMLEAVYGSQRRLMLVCSPEQACELFDEMSESVCSRMAFEDIPVDFRLNGPAGMRICGMKVHIVPGCPGYFLMDDSSNVCGPPRMPPPDMYKSEYPAATPKPRKTNRKSKKPITPPNRRSRLRKLVHRAGLKLGHWQHRRADVDYLPGCPLCEAKRSKATGDH